MVCAQAANDLLRAADQHADSGRINLARSEYERAIKAGAHLEKDFVRSRSLGLCYLNGSPHDFVRASQWLANAVALNGASDETRLSYARSLAWGGRYDDAIPQFQKLVDAQPRNTEYVLGLANALQWKKDTDRAVATLEHYLDRVPSNINMRLEYARTLSFGQRYTEALNQYQVILQADPRNVAADVGIAKVTSWQGQLPAALDLYNKILSKHSDNADAWAGKAFTLLWMQRKEEARAAFTSAQRLNPSDPEVRSALKALIASMPAKTAAPVVVASAPAAVEVAPKVEETPAVVEAVAPAAPLAVEAPAPPPDNVTRLSREAEVAAAQQHYPEAISADRQILAIDPVNYAARLQLARVLSWSNDFEHSAQEYAVLLAAKPDETAVRAERARVLSWGKDYSNSLEEYRQVLQELENGPNRSGPDKSVTIASEGLEYVRVLSWARRYDESLTYADTLLARTDLEQKQRAELLLTKAHVLSWSKKYDDALVAFEAAGKNGADPREVSLGMGQTLYWSGHLQRSRVVLASLLKEHTADPDASFTLAAVEHNMGHNGRSMQLLKSAPDNTDTREFRASLKDSMRPVLRFRFGFEDDNDITDSAPIPTTATKVLRYGTTLEFSATPDVRMEVVNTVSQSLTSNAVLGQFADRALITENLARATFSPAQWLRMTVGAGAAITGSALHSGSGTAHFIYDVHPVITRGPVRIDLAFSGRAADYNPLAVHESVTSQRQAVAATYEWRSRIRFTTEYAHAMYSVDSFAGAAPFHLQPQSNSASVGIVPIWIRGEKYHLEAGVRYEVFGFGHDSEKLFDPSIGGGSAGFFAPALYHRPAGVARFIWQLPSAFSLDADGTFGPQRISRLGGPKPTFGPAGSFGVQLSKDMKRFRPFLRYDYFDTHTPASPSQFGGGYRSQLFSFGLDLRL